jgi:hypothetical protein
MAAGFKERLISLANKLRGEWLEKYDAKKSK